MNDHIIRTLAISYCEHKAIERVRKIYRDLYWKPPFPVAVHNVESLVPFEELDDYL